MKETLGFQAEVRQLLRLMIHSLYSNREIFLRELISNASDACDRLRFEAIKSPALLEAGEELSIGVDYDKNAKTITVSDNGIGMTRDEVVLHLGTIARSGTREFFEKLTGDQQKDAQLIGQFGVGFYSAFIVADRVTVISRRAGLPAAEAVRWESDGAGEFTVELSERSRRGTDVIKALALGAHFVWIGRPFLYAAIAGGEAGVQRAINLLHAEIDRDLALLGIRSLSEITPDLVRKF